MAHAQICDVKTKKKKVDPPNRHPYLPPVDSKAPLTSQPSHHHPTHLMLPIRRHGAPPAPERRRVLPGLVRQGQHQRALLLLSCFCCWCWCCCSCGGGGGAPEQEEEASHGGGQRRPTHGGGGGCLGEEGFREKEGASDWPRPCFFRRCACCLPARDKAQKPSSVYCGVWGGCWSVICVGGSGKDEIQVGIHPPLVPSFEGRKADWEEPCVPCAPRNRARRPLDRIGPPQSRGAGVVVVVVAREPSCCPLLPSRSPRQAPTRVRPVGRLWNWRPRFTGSTDRSIDGLGILETLIGRNSAQGVAFQLCVRSAAGIELPNQGRG